MPDFEYLKYIRVFGAPEDPEECFQGLGASAAGGVTVEAGENGEVNVSVEPTPPIEPLIDSALWEAQNNVIREQSAFMGDISDVYALRMSKVPEQKQFWEEMWEDFQQESVEFFLGNLIGALLGNTAGEAAEFLYALVMSTYENLKNSYNQASKLCEHLIKENTELLNLSKTVAHYKLRTEALKQHDASLKNIIKLIETLEETVKTGKGGSGDAPTVNVRLAPADVDLGYMKMIADGPVSSVIS